MNTHQKAILPSIEELTSKHPDTSYEVLERDIVIHHEELPYSFTFSYFERFGWQAFLMPKSFLVEDDFSHSIYEDLQTIATTYNKSLDIQEKPELNIFPIQ